MALFRQDLIQSFFAAAPDGFARRSGVARLLGPIGGATGIVGARSGRLVEVLQTCTQIATAGAATYTAEQVLAGIISRSPAGANRTDTLPTAALLVAAIPQPKVGDTVHFWVYNSAASDAYTLTIAAGNGGTLVGSAIVGVGSVAHFILQITGVTTPAYTVYRAEQEAAGQNLHTQVAISSASITGTSAGQLGHAAGVVLVPDPGAGKVVELVSVIMSYTYATAAYTGGGNITVNINGGAALTGLVAAANSLGAGASNVVQFNPLAAAAAVLTVNKGLNLVAASAFTQPGTAAGTVKVFTTYRVHTL